MALLDKVNIASRFQRSVQIDADLDDEAILRGFVCPKSSADILLSMAKHISETGHGAFTWTGPYGGGKSSLVVAFGALLSGNKKRRALAQKAIGDDTASTILSSLPVRKTGWNIVPVVGSREDPLTTIGRALEKAGAAKQKNELWSAYALIAALEGLAALDPKTSGGLILFVDEMGQFLEGAARNGTDLFIFQQIAEAASRSKGRLVVVGILHQTFEEYATRLSRENKDEWAKIQGRFIDLAVNVAGEEQLSLIGRAIETDGIPDCIDDAAERIAKIIREQRAAASPHMAEALQHCWPLHPVVASLLGPISRHRFGQNQRSIFGFLNSVETEGFQDFLRTAGESSLYEPAQLWDYLRLNLEPSILASPDGHRWSLAIEVIQRCEGMGAEKKHLGILKCIALINLFRDRSGLVPSDELLLTCDIVRSKADLKKTLAQLQDWSLIIRRKFAGDYAIYAGSDFDIENATEKALFDIGEIDFEPLKNLADIHPVLAKRHYHEVGVLRWFDVEIASILSLKAIVGNYQPVKGAMGLFVLALPTEGETEEECEKECREAGRVIGGLDIVIGLSLKSWSIAALAKQLLALELVHRDRPELAGDAVARREVDARISAIKGQLSYSVQVAFDSAKWFRKHHPPSRLLQSELNSLASTLADQRFNRSPIIRNELLNRIKPSTNAVAGRNMLLRRMVLNEGQERLGITEFPVEGGLFVSVLEATDLYAQQDGRWQFCNPQRGRSDPYNLWPLWDSAERYLKENGGRSVTASEIYEIWRTAPYGLREGLMPIFIVAFILANSTKLAFYREGVFQAQLNDLDMDYLVNEPADIQIRWMALSDVSRRVLTGMAEIVRDMEPSHDLANLEPITVARGLIAIYDGVPRWTTKTMRLSKNAMEVRNLFKRANDPNKFLFDDLPGSLATGARGTVKAKMGELVQSVRDGLEEMTEAYPNMLRRLRDVILAELQVPNSGERSLAELRSRAKNALQLAGDYRIDAFVSRLAVFDSGLEQVEGLVSLAANKPPRDWGDLDIDRAAVELAELAQRFVRVEAFARVKGRPDKRHAMAVFVGINGRPTPVVAEFDVTDEDREQIVALVNAVELTLAKSEQEQGNIILAALAELSAKYLQPKYKNPRERKREQGRVFT